MKLGIKTKISETLFDDLDQYSKVHQRPKTWIIREALKVYLAKEQILDVSVKDNNKILASFECKI